MKEIDMHQHMVVALGYRILLMSDLLSHNTLSLTCTK